jgi:hypothetical protein
VIRIQTVQTLLIALVVGGSLSPKAQAQQTVPVDVTVTSPVGVNVTVISPFDASLSVPSFPNTPIDPGLSAIPGIGSTEIRAEVCEGIGDPLQAGINRFVDLTRQYEAATSADQRAVLERELSDAALRLPPLVVEDLGSRGLARGQSQECDDLIESIKAFLDQVAEYMALLEDARTALLW